MCLFYKKSSFDSCSYIRTKAMVGLDICFEANERDNLCALIVSKDPQYKRYFCYRMTLGLSDQCNLSSALREHFTKWNFVLAT